MRFSNPGAPMIEPPEATGLPPMQTNSCVRSTSGTGIRNWCPNIACEATMWGNWSTLVAEYRFWVRTARMKSPTPSMAPRLCTVGLPA